MHNIRWGKGHRPTRRRVAAFSGFNRAAVRECRACSAHTDTRCHAHAHVRVHVHARLHALFLAYHSCVPTLPVQIGASSCKCARECCVKWVLIKQMRACTSTCTFACGRQFHCTLCARTAARRLPAQPAPAPTLMWPSAAALLALSEPRYEVRLSGIARLGSLRCSEARAAAAEAEAPPTVPCPALLLGPWALTALREEREVRESRRGAVALAGRWAEGRGGAVVLAGRWAEGQGGAVAWPASGRSWGARVCEGAGLWALLAPCCAAGAGENPQLPSPLLLPPPPPPPAAAAAAALAAVAEQGLGGVGLEVGREGCAGA